MFPDFIGPFALGLLVGGVVVLVAVYFFIEIMIVPKEDCPPANFNGEP